MPLLKTKYMANTTEKGCLHFSIQLNHKNIVGRYILDLINLARAN